MPLNRGPLREHRYDVILNGEGFMVAGSEAGKPQWREEAFATELGGTPPIGEVSVDIRTNHLGYGYSERYVPGCYDYTVNMDCSIPGVTLMGPLVTSITGVADGSNNVTDFFEISSTLYAIGGRYCRKINTSTDALVTLDAEDATTGKDFGASTISSKAIQFDGSIFVGFTSSTFIWKFTGAAWSQSSDVNAKYWAKDWLDVTGAVGWRLWRAYSTNSVDGVLTGSDPTVDSNYGPATAFSIGDTDSAITGMVGARHAIWVMKTDGVYGMDQAGRATNLLEPLSRLRSTNNGVNPILVDDWITFPHLMGLMSFNPRAAGKNIQNIQPGGDPGNTSPVYGRVTAQAYLAGWHYAALYNGTDTYIMKGRRVRDGESVPEGFIGPYIWHPIAKVAANTVNCMHISGLTTPNRLWMGVGQDVAYITVSPTNNVLSESSHKFATSGNLYFSPLDFDARGVAKELASLDIENRGFSSTTYAAALYSLDGGSYTAWGRNATAAGRARIPRPSTGTWRTFNSQLRLDLTNAANTSTPKIKSVVPRASLRPQYEDVITMQLRIQDGVGLRDLSEDRASARVLITKLQTLRNAAPVSLTDYWSGKARTRTVVVERVQEQLIEQVGNEPVSWGAEVVVRVKGNVGSYFRWDGTSFWDGSHTWA